MCKPKYVTDADNHRTALGIDSSWTIITLIGSTRFKRDYEAVMKELTLADYVVISVGCYGHNDHDPRINDKKSVLDSMHLYKIEIADIICVINTGGYIGSSTANEIEHAKTLGKPIIYMV